MTPFLLPTLKVGRIQSPPVWAHLRQRTGSGPFSHRTLLRRHDRQAAILEARCSGRGEAWLLWGLAALRWTRSGEEAEGLMRAASCLTVTVSPISWVSIGRGHVGRVDGRGWSKDAKCVWSTNWWWLRRPGCGNGAPKEVGTGQVQLMSSQVNTLPTRCCASSIVDGRMGRRWLISMGEDGQWMDRVLVMNSSRRFRLQVNYAAYCVGCSVLSVQTQKYDSTQCRVMIK